MSDAIGPTILHAGPAADHEPPRPSPAPPVTEPQPQAPQQASEIVDDEGRHLSLRAELTFLQEMDLKALAGNDRSQNMEWFTMVMLCARVAAIDGGRMPFPSNEVTLRAMLQRVGRGGARALINHFSPANDTAEQDEETEAKN